VKATARAALWRGSLLESWSGLVLAIIIAIAATFISDHRGGPTLLYALLIGMALTLPGASYLAAIVSIHKLDYAAAPTVLLVVGVNLVMLWIIDLPLIGFFLAPDATRVKVDRAKAWVFSHGRTFAVRGFAVIGAALVLKGVIGLIA